MKQQAKATSAGSIEGNGKSRGFLRRAFATRDASSDAKGIGARSPQHLPLALIAVLTAIAVLAFTAVPALAAAPTGTVDPPAGSHYTTIHLTGTLDPGDDLPNEPVYYTFETSTDGVNWSEFNFNNFSFTFVRTGEGPQPVSGDLSGLAYNTTYFVRLAASYGGAEVGSSPPQTFTTNPEPTTAPVLATKAASPADVEYTRAHLSGTIDPEGGNVNSNETVPIHWHFQYSTDPVDLGWSDGPGGEISGAQAESSAPIAVSADATGLTQHSNYLYRLVASYGDLPAESPEPYEAFETLEVLPPSVSIDPIATFTDTSAHFSGNVDPNAPGAAPQDPGFDTSWSFHCSPECPGLSGATIPADNGNHVVEANASGLEPDTTYEVTLEASNAAGPASDVKTFTTTEISPTVKAAPGAPDGQGGYTLQAVVNPHNSILSDCKFEYGTTAIYPNTYTAPCFPAPGRVNRVVTVEAHLEALTVGATYHARFVVANGTGAIATADQVFVPTLEPRQACPNEALRKENSSLALPECRAYEQVSASSKGGNPAKLYDYTEDASVAYESTAGNIDNSGQGNAGAANLYVTTRTNTGWETIPNLNGPTGSLYTGPEGLSGAGNLPVHYSADLRSSFWYTKPGGKSHRENGLYLRNPDGTFTLIGNGNFGEGSVGVSGENYLGADLGQLVGFSADLSHVVFNGISPFGVVYGPGLYEFVGTGNIQPRRIDLDNSGQPVSACGNWDVFGRATVGNFVSADGRVIFFTAGGGCGGSPAANELWARVGGTASYDVSASHCGRAGADPCNAPAPAVFQGAAKDGSRVYFTTTQQLVNGDTDETNDLYACDIPPGTPTPTGTANACSSLSEVSGAATGADVEGVARISDDGSTVYFVAQGVLAANDDAFGEAAVPGADNLYVWRKDATHPAGQTTFIARLQSNDIGGAQTTAEGRYLAFTTASPLVPTDTDTARDVYRYDADIGQLTRVSTNVFGVGGNVDGLDANIESIGQHSHGDISSDGDSIVFETNEALSSLDGNGEPDVYLWKAGHVSLISTGSSSPSSGNSSADVRPRPAIDGSGKDIYFKTAQALTPSDGDDVSDVYDARVGGGFSFSPAASPCVGEACQPPASDPPVAPTSQANQPNGIGNFKAKHCPKGKVLRSGRCQRKQVKKHHKKPGKQKQTNADRRVSR